MMVRGTACRGQSSGSNLVSVDIRISVILSMSVGQHLGLGELRGVGRFCLVQKLNVVVSLGDMTNVVSEVSQVEHPECIT